MCTLILRAAGICFNYLVKSMRLMRGAEMFSIDFPVENISALQMSSLDPSNWSLTPLKFNSSPLKYDSWKMIWLPFGAQRQVLEGSVESCPVGHGLQVAPKTWSCDVVGSQRPTKWNADVGVVNGVFFFWNPNGFESEFAIFLKMMNLILLWF